MVKAIVHMQTYEVSIANNTLKGTSGSTRQLMLIDYNYTLQWLYVDCEKLQSLMLTIVPAFSHGRRHRSRL